MIVGVMRDCVGLGISVGLLVGTLVGIRVGGICDNGLGVGVMTQAHPAVFGQLGFLHTP
jgi:hypothetical protein